MGGGGRCGERMKGLGCLFLVLLQNEGGVVGFAEREIRRWGEWEGSYTAA